MSAENGPSTDAIEGLPSALVDWLSPRDPKASLAFIHDIAECCCRLGGQHSAHLYGLVQNGSFRDVLGYSVPTDADLEDYRYAVQIQGLLKKNPWVDLGFNPLREGVLAFVKGEKKCALTNIILEDFRPQGRVAKVFHLARCKIKEILGGVPPLSAFQFRYGPGATTSVKSAAASMSSKLDAILSCSEDLMPTVGEFLAELPLLVEHHCEKSTRMLPYFEPCPDGVSYLVKNRVEVRKDDGKLVFVPKDAKTHRPILVEPTLNGMFQLGVGSYLKGRLASHGIDLHDQNRNRNLALRGSVDGSLATIDLSSASDTVSWRLVADLLPDDWFELLAQLRTGTATYEGITVRLEKFSSMGNGYTFELESLLFYGLAFGCVSLCGLPVSDIGIFGDDIIIPTEAVELLFEVFDYAGFWVNPQKSFWRGPFRESCGSDWLNGNDVRPFYIRDHINDKTLYNFHNWLMRRGERELAKICKNWTWEPIRLYGPDGYGDGHLIGSYDLYRKRYDRRAGYGGGYFDTYSLRPQRKNILRGGDWIVPAYSVYTRAGAESPTDPYSIRGSNGYVRTAIYTFTERVFCSV